MIRNRRGPATVAPAVKPRLRSAAPAPRRGPRPADPGRGRALFYAPGASPGRRDVGTAVSLGGAEVERVRSLATLRRRAGQAATQAIVVAVSEARRAALRSALAISTASPRPLPVIAIVAPDDARSAAQAVLQGAHGVVLAGRSRATPWSRVLAEARRNWRRAVSELRRSRSPATPVRDVTGPKAVERRLARAAMILDQIHDAVIATDVQGRITRWNRGAERLLGYPESEALGMPIQRLYFDVDVPGYEADVRNRVLHEGSAELEIRQRHRDGRAIWCSLRLSVLRDEQGALTGILGYAIDVSESHRLHDEKRQGEERFRALLEGSDDGILVLDPTGVVRFANPAAAAMLGEPVDAAAVASVASGEDGRQIAGIALPARPGGYAEVRVAHTQWDGNDARLVLLRDVTRQREAEALGKLRERAIEASANGVSIADALGDDMPLVYVNAAFERLTGYRRDEVLGRNCRFLQSGDSDQPALEDVRRALREGREAHAVIRNYRKDGTLFWNEFRLTPLRDESGAVTHFVGIQVDVSDAKRYEAELAYRGSHDSLTHLPNRNLFEDRIRQAIALARRSTRPFAVMFVDLDRFKTINDAEGHQVGDQILRTVAERLVAQARGGDTVARLGGDEFVLLCPELSGENDAAVIARRVLAVVAEPIEIGDRRMHVTCSVGVGLFPKDGTEPESLLRAADLAMYRAKDEGRSSSQFFTTGLNERIRRRVSIETSLRRALDRGEFVLHFQPQVSLDSGRVVGAEALIRWQHPERGLILPGEFIPVAEETGLIVPIGQWVLEAACRQSVQWRSAVEADLVVSINVSAVELRRANFATRLQSVLERGGLDPRALEIELTETAVASASESYEHAFAALKSLGVRIAIDDFGIGYSSLSYLKRFPIDKIKIDQSFIHDIVTDSDDAAIVRAVVAMSHQLKLSVVAEGVETATQAAFLRRTRCDLVQGLLFGRPCAADEFGAMLSLHQTQLPPQVASRARRLLLVDDEENNLRALKRALRREGYEIHTAQSARDALEILGSTPIGVIVSDQRMPEMSGTEFLARVRSMHPATVRIILSGHTELSTVTEAINQGAVYRFLTKPWEDGVLREDLRQAFRLHEELVDRES